MNRTRVVLGVTALAALGLASIALRARAAEQSSAPSEQAQTQAAAAAQIPKPLVIPEQEKNRKNPVPPVKEALESGRSLFQSQCAMCHGPRGDGKGDLATRLGVKPPDFTDPRTQAKRTDGELFYIITRGHGHMPGEGDRLHPQNKWEIVTYIRTLASAAPPKP